MKEKIKKLIKRAYQSLKSAKLLMENNDFDSSVSRSYYAMFYSAEAVLLTKNLRFSSHKSVISLFGQHFVKTEIFPSELGKNINKIYDKRLTGDYSFEPVINRTTAEKSLIRAEYFVERIEEYLEKEGLYEKNI
ncbi:MAG: HEPN domain-containing protein [Candidatus Cloacimonetes bacterium]|nr:HEPN domain-containing protein [Candidatus Cloacimonadota bacterium]